MPQITSTLREDRRAGPEFDRDGQAEAPKRENRALESLVIERTIALSESQHLLYTMPENMDQGLVFLDQDQTVRLCNPRALELLRLPAGDEVLRSFAIAVSSHIRSIDRLGRYGGEEFLLVLPKATAEQAAAAVDRLRDIVGDLDWTAVSDNLAVTFSAGVTELRANEAVDEVLARVDAALYRAKNAGRNRVETA